MEPTTNDTEQIQAGPPSLMMLCCQVIAVNANSLESLDYIPDELVMAICERAPGIQLAHVDRIVSADEYRMEVLQANTSIWHNRCRERWDQQLQEICRKCNYARDRSYWKLIYLTGAIQDGLNTAALEGAPEVLAEIVDLAKDCVTSMSLQHATRETLSIMSKNFQHLQVLDLTGCGLCGKEDARAVAQVMLAAPTLISATLSKNELGKENGITSIAVAVAKHNALVCLNVTWNSIDDQGAKALAQALQRNPHISMMDARWNDFSMDGRQKLLQVMKTRPSSLRLQLI